MPIRDIFKLRQLSRRDILAFLRFMARRFSHARLQQVAGNLTFTTLLSLVPLLTIALALFTMFPAFGTLRASLQAYFTQVMMPKPIATTVLRYLTIFTNKAGSLSVIGAVGVLLGSVALISMIERSFNQIWQVRHPRLWYKRLALCLSIGVLGPFILAISLTFTTQIYAFSGGSIRHPSFWQASFYALLSLLWTMAAFTLIYVVIPNRTVLWREAVCGGIFSAIAFEIAKRLFAIFIIQFSTYKSIYGALTAVPVFLVWIYLSWLITLSGAAFVAAMHYLWHGRWRHVPSRGSAFVEALDILEVLQEARGDGVDEATLRQRTGLGLDEIEAALHRMQEAGWVEMFHPAALVRLRERKLRANRADVWRLTVDPDQLTLAQVFRLFVFDPPMDSPIAKKIDRVIGEGLGESLSRHFARDVSARAQQVADHNAAHDTVHTQCPIA